MTNAPELDARPGALRQVLALLGGTLLAQIIAFVAQMGVARLYTDTDLGYLGVFTSAATLGAAVAGARFDLSIVLPSPGDEASARSLARLASRCVLAASSLATLVAVLARPWLEERYGRELAAWMLAVGVSILFLAQGQVCSYWLTRHRRFRHIAASSVVRSGAIAALQLLCGFLASETKRIAREELSAPGEASRIGTTMRGSLTRAASVNACHDRSGIAAACASAK